MGNEHQIITSTYLKKQKIANEIIDYYKGLKKRIDVAEISSKNKNSPLRFDPNYSVALKLKNILRTYKTMSDDEAFLLTADELRELYLDYLELTVGLNTVIIYTPTKIDFCAYACISVEAYNKLMVIGDDDVKRQISDIDADLIDVTEKATELGVKTPFTEVRLKAKKTGHAVQEALSLKDAVETVKTAYEGYEIEQRLQAIVRPDQKKLPKKK